MIGLGHATPGVRPDLPGSIAPDSFGVLLNLWESTLSVAALGPFGHALTLRPPKRSSNLARWSSSVGSSTLGLLPTNTASIMPRVVTAWSIQHSMTIGFLASMVFVACPCQGR